MSAILLPPNEFAAEALRAPFMITPGALERFSRAEIDDAVMRHLAMDWSDMDEDDQDMNRAAAMEGGARVFSAYRVRDKVVCDLWVITEADRSVTTILLPSEY